MPKKISSLQNPRVKYILQLSERTKRRKAEGAFVIEGRRELSLAIKGGYEIQSLFYDPTLIDELNIREYMTEMTDVSLISSKIYKKIAYRGSTEGVIAIAKDKTHTLNNLDLKSEEPLILVIESAEKPGNVGALLRTADAAKVDAVIIANPKTDFYNPNVIRSSVGGVFTIPIATASSAETIDFLNEKKIAIYSAILQQSEIYDKVNLKLASAIVVGSESTGLSQKWRSAASKKIRIPMMGLLDSMNVSVAAGILLYEARRQRKFSI